MYFLLFYAAVYFAKKKSFEIWGESWSTLNSWKEKYITNTHLVIYACRTENIHFNPKVLTIHHEAKGKQGQDTFNVWHQNLLVEVPGNDLYVQHTNQ